MVIREVRKHFGFIPVIMLTDHGNIARLEHLPIIRIEAKHYRWFAEIVCDGSMFLHIPFGAKCQLPCLSVHPFHLLARTR